MNQLYTVKLTKSEASMLLTQIDNKLDMIQHDPAFEIVTGELKTLKEKIFLSTGLRVDRW